MQVIIYLLQLDCRSEFLCHLQSLHGHVPPVVVNYKFKCAIRGTAPPDPTQRLASDCGWNSWLSHILEPEATFLGKEKGGILVKPRTQSRVPSCSCTRIALTAAMRTRYSVYFQRLLTVLGVYSKKIIIKRKPNLIKFQARDKVIIISAKLNC